MKKNIQYRYTQVVKGYVVEENLTPEKDPNKKDEFDNIPEPSPPFNEQPSTQELESGSTFGKEQVVDEPEPSEEPKVDPENIDEKTRNQISNQEERTWAALAHLSVLLNLFTGFLGTIAALVIYLVYKDRSRLVAYHAMQSFVFQTITWFGAGILAVIFITFGSALFFLVIPLIFVIIGLVLLLAIPASLIYGVVGAVQVNNGEDFHYWQVGKWVRNILEPESKL